MSKQIPNAIRSISRERAPHFYKVTKTIAVTDIEIGQIWSTRSVLELPGLPVSQTDDPRLIVTLSATSDSSNQYDQLMALPISLKLSMATDFDFIVSEDESPLNYRFMIEIWNEVPVLRGHLKQCLGKLPDEVIRALTSIHAARLLGEEIPADVKMRTGLPLMGENDGRVVFQQSEIEALEYLAQVATSVVFREFPASDLKTVSDKAPQWWRFEILPRLGKVTDYYLRSPRPAFASSSPAGNEMIIAQTEGEHQFTFELLVRRRESLVYLFVHDFAPSMEGHFCRVTLVMPDTEIQSEVAKLEKGEEIPIARISSFDRKHIQNVIVEIEG